MAFYVLTLDFRQQLDWLCNHIQSHAWHDKRTLRSDAVAVPAECGVTANKTIFTLLCLWYDSVIESGPKQAPSSQCGTSGAITDLTSTNMPVNMCQSYVSCHNISQSCVLSQQHMWYICSSKWTKNYTHILVIRWHCLIFLY